MLAANLISEAVIRGEYASYMAPTYKYVSPMWDELKKILEPIIIHKDEQEKRIKLLTGGEIEMWSLDKDVSRGRKYHLVVIDEAAMVAHLQKAWQEAIRPTLTDYRGKAWFCSTPKGFNFFKRVYDMGQDPLKPDWVSWKIPTSANPYIDLEEIEAARQELPETVFNQEYLAEFLQGEGTVFRRIREAAILEKQDPYPGRFVFGLDWAREQDFTVVAVVDANTRKMVDLDRFNKIGWSVQRDRVKTLYEKWRPASIIAESNSIGSPNIEALQHEGLPVVPFETTASSKPQLIQSLALGFERAELKILNDPVLVAELEAYEQKISQITGRVSYNAPEGMHDDTVMALALAWSGIVSKASLITDWYAKQAEMIKQRNEEARKL